MSQAMRKLLHGMPAPLEMLLGPSMPPCDVRQHPRSGCPIMMEYTFSAESANDDAHNDHRLEEIVRNLVHVP